MSLYSRLTAAQSTQAPGTPAADRPPTAADRSPTAGRLQPTDQVNEVRLRIQRRLADELGPRGVRVNGLLPGRVGTERVDELDASTGDAESAREKAIATIPLGRYGRPKEFAAAADQLQTGATAWACRPCAPTWRAPIPPPWPSML